MKNKDRIADLEARLASAEARLASLEARTPWTYWTTTPYVPKPFEITCTSTRVADGSGPQWTVNSGVN